MVYILCFAVSAGFAYLASKSDNRRKFLAFSFLSIAVMVTLAGLRDYSIGTDTMNYLMKDQYWKGAVGADSFFDYLSYYFPFGYGEPLFAILMGFIAQLTGEYRVFLFVVHFIIITGVYVGAFRQRKYVNPAFVLLIFYLFFYNYSLNVMRQYMAMAIVFAFLPDIHEKKYWRYCVAVIVAMMFHTTAILGFGSLILYFLLYFKNKRFNIDIRQRKPIIAGILFIGVLFFGIIIRLMVKIVILHERYLFFIENDAVSPAIIVMAIVVLGIVAADYFREPMREKCEYYDFYFMGSVVYLILLQLTFTLAFGRRISFYISMVDLITIGLIESSQKDEKKQKFVRVAILLVALVYWIYSYALKNGSETMPYVLGI